MSLEVSQITSFLGTVIGQIIHYVQTIIINQMAMFDPFLPLFQIKRKYVQNYF